MNGTWLFGLLQWKNVHIYKYFIIAKNVTFDYKITDGYAYTFILHHYTCGCPVVEINMTQHTLLMTNCKRNKISLNWTVKSWSKSKVLLKRCKIWYQNVVGCSLSAEKSLGREEDKDPKANRYATDLFGCRTKAPRQRCMSCWTGMVFAVFSLIYFWVYDFNIIVV